MPQRGTMHSLPQNSWTAYEATLFQTASIFTVVHCGFKERYTFFTSGKAFLTICSQLALTICYILYILYKCNVTANKRYFCWVLLEGEKKIFATIEEHSPKSCTLHLCTSQSYTSDINFI